MEKQKDIIKDILKDSKIRGMIFDFDGTIVNLFVDWSGLKQQLRDKFLINKETSLGKILIEIRDRFGANGLEGAYNLIRDYELGAIEKATINEDILEIIKKCYKKNIKLGIFSSNIKETVYYFLDKLNIRHLFDIVVAKEDVEFCKPEIEGLQLIVDKWEIDKKRLVFIGNDNMDRLCGEKMGIKSLII